MSKKAAILGLGKRGCAWATLLRDAGWRVTGFDPDPSVDELPSVRRGWRRAQTISTTVGFADWVLVCLPDRLELMQKVIQRAQAEAPDNAVIAVLSEAHDVEAVQSCSLRPGRVVLLTGTPGDVLELHVSGRNDPEIKLEVLAVLSELCPSPSVEAANGAAEGAKSA